jgi:site-specific DNA-adenine methylase
VWRHLGAPDLYIEPFAGSLAVLLARPSAPKNEIAVDLDGLLLNFWRALQTDWEVVASYLGGPQFEKDIHARHAALLDARTVLNEKLDDPRYCDPELAAWWWQGISSWIGKGYGWKPARQRPHIDRSLKGAWAVGLTDERIAAVAARISTVQFLRGDWTGGMEAWERACTPAIINRWKRSTVGVFLDPPYATTTTTRRAKGLYAEDEPLNKAVIDWCLHQRRHAKVVLAGYKDEYEPLLDAGWDVVHWKAPNGYAGDSNSRRTEDVLFVSQNVKTLRRSSITR